jgi:CheY-like chemotaxis protein
MRRKLDEHDRLYKYVQIIEGAARRGSSLTRQLLTFARKTETVAKTVNVNSLIEETLHMFERSVSKEIVVKTDLTTEAAIITGDEGQIQQALLNLFLNARDAMPSGGTLSVSTKTILADAHLASRFVSFKPGPFVVITAADTGTGMDKAVQDRVFEPFFTTKDHGTGLGLSVTYGVVQSNGGFINVESELGRGSTFSIYLPRTVDAGRTETRQKRQRLPRGKENILVVDDELSVCEIARDMLTDLGYSVAAVHDGKAGVDYYKARQGSIDLVLLDMNMPLMGGIQAFEEFRTINPSLRIIILTGYGRGVIETPDMAAAVNAFVQKPFQLEELALKVRQVLDARTAEAELTS